MASRSWPAAAPAALEVAALVFPGAGFAQVGQVGGVRGHAVGAPDHAVVRPPARVIPSGDPQHQLHHFHGGLARGPRGRAFLHDAEPAADHIAGVPFHELLPGPLFLVHEHNGHRHDPAVLGPVRLFVPVEEDVFLVRRVHRPAAVDGALQSLPVFLRVTVLGPSVAVARSVRDPVVPSRDGEVVGHPAVVGPRGVGEAGTVSGDRDQVGVVHGPAGEPHLCQIHVGVAALGPGRAAARLHVLEMAVEGLLRALDPHLPPLGHHHRLLPVLCIGLARESQCEPACEQRETALAGPARFEHVLVLPVGGCSRRVSGLHSPVHVLRPDPACRSIGPLPRRPG